MIITLFAVGINAFGLNGDTGFETCEFIGVKLNRADSILETAQNRADR